MPDRNGVCPLEELINAIGGKWKVIILRQVLTGPKRFSELRRCIPDVTQKMLTQQLRELEDKGFLTRTVVVERPLHVEYHPTTRAQAMAPLLQSMHDWAKDHLDPAVIDVPENTAGTSTS